MPSTDYRLWKEIVRFRWLAVALAITMGIWCAVDVMPRGVINHKRIFEHRTDFTVYTEAGAAFFDGRDPYVVSNPRGWRYLYPPLFAIVISPLHHLSSTSQVAVWFLLSLALLLGCYYEMRRLLGICLATEVDSRQRKLILGFAAAGLLVTLLPALNCLQRGQVEILKLYLLLLGLRMALSARNTRGWIVAGAVLSIPGVLKLTPLLPVACLVLFEGSRLWFLRQTPGPRGESLRRGFGLGFGAALGLVLFALVLPASVLGWNANLHHLHTWYGVVVTKAVDVRTSDFGEDVRTVRNQSFDNAAYRFGNWMDFQIAGASDDSLVDFPHTAGLQLPMDNKLAGELLVGVRILALLMLFAFVIQAAVSGEMLARCAAFGMGCVATLVACPVARGCYFMLFLPATFFTATWLLRSGRVRSALAIAWMPAILVWAYYLGLPSSGRVGLLGLGTAAWFFATTVVLRQMLNGAFAGSAEETVRLLPHPGPLPLGCDRQAA